MIARPDGDGVTLRLKVVPGAKRTEVVGPLGEALKVAVAAPPSGGAANAAVIELLADNLGMPRRQISLTAGHTSSRKVVRVARTTIEAVARSLGL